MNEILTMLIERYGLRSVLSSIKDVCNEKADMHKEDAVNNSWMLKWTNAAQAVGECAKSDEIRSMP